MGVGEGVAVHDGGRAEQQTGADFQGPPVLFGGDVAGYELGTSAVLADLPGECGTRPLVYVGEDD